MQCKDISTIAILEYLYDKQGEWTCLWYGHFKKDSLDSQGYPHTDVYWAMPEGTPPKLALAKMRKLHKQGLVGGCPCGCRGDFEITDKGLALLVKPRLTRYNGY